jgi:hypothetical protein
LENFGYTFVMDQIEIVRQRMYAQGLAQPVFTRPVDVVRWLGALQSQDFEGAKWALAQRALGLTQADIQAAYDRGDLLRLHLMRPTWHFVDPADVRWILDLTAQRLNRKLSSYDRRLELDDAIYSRSNAVIRAALEGGQQRTRQELADELRRAGVEPGSVQRLAHLMMRAEQDGIICSGARRGNQYPYALLEERVSESHQLEGEAALAELTRRYFQSHGPATLNDFCWWSGLPVADARAGLALQHTSLEQAVLGGKTYYFSGEGSLSGWHSPTVYLLPNYDESVGSYKDHRISIDPRYWENWNADYAASFRLYSHHLLVDGLIVGQWRRAVSKDSLEIGLKLFGKLADVEYQAVEEAAVRYGRFLGLPVVVKLEH